MPRKEEEEEEGEENVLDSSVRNLSSSNPKTFDVWFGSIFEQLDQLLLMTYLSLGRRRS